MSPTCPPWYGCHGNGHCLATAHWTFSSYGRLEAERVNKFWWNLVHNSKLRPQRQSRDQILKFLKFKMADGRYVRKCWKCYSSHTNRPTWTKLGRSHPIISPICPQWCSCHGNGHCIATAHWTLCSYGRLVAKRVIQFCWNFLNSSKLGPQWQLRDQILKFLKFKIADGRHVGKYSKCHNSPTNRPTGTQLGWWHPIMSPTCPHDAVAMVTADVY